MDGIKCLPLLGQVLIGPPLVMSGLSRLRP
jgi:hypothetical protein